MHRRVVIVGNWKMHFSEAEAVPFIHELIARIRTVKSSVYIAPSFTSIRSAKEVAAKGAVCIGAQNMSEFLEGAYTGEVSSEMLKRAGASFVLIGHSERRHLFGEDSGMIHRKMKLAVRENLEPILCVGETGEEYKRGVTEGVLYSQLREALKGFTSDQIEKVVLAYEPVWAIGTGEAATSEIAQMVHHLCRTFLNENWGDEIGNGVPILYGGSVGPENVADLIQKRDIDGVLVGSASLQLDSFVQIIQNVEETVK